MQVANYSQARGIAANSGGTVWTILRVVLDGQVEASDRLVSFSVDFPEGRGAKPAILAAAPTLQFRNGQR